MTSNNTTIADRIKRLCEDRGLSLSRLSIQAGLGKGAAGEEAAGDVLEEDVLAASRFQVAAGYIYYGPATLLVVTTGGPVAMFALSDGIDAGDGPRFLLVGDRLLIPQEGSEYSINMAYERFWDQPTRSYIADCQAGRNGPRNRDFNMRWSGAMIADVHKLFVRGGVFIYPALDRPGSETGKLRFLYEALPMAMLVGNAGGGAIMGQQDIIGFRPGKLHQRVPVFMGSAGEIAILRTLYE